MINEKCETSNRDNQKLHSECVMVAVIRSFKSDVDQVYGNVSTQDVHYFHDTVINRYKADKEIHISCCEDQSKKNLTLPRDA